MKLKFYQSDGLSSEVKDYAIPEFEGTKGVPALKQYLVAYQANNRQGTASTKTRAEVSGTGKKPFRQKGTGSARQGSRRANQWRGGGVVFGPRPRDFSKSMNRKMRRLAFNRAIFDRASSGEIDVVERFEPAEAKTREFSVFLEKVAPRGSVLVVDDTFSDNTLLAARNITRVAVTDADSLNAFELSLYDRILMSEKGIEKVLSRAATGAASS